MLHYLHMTFYFNIILVHKKKKLDQTIEEVHLGTQSSIKQPSHTTHIKLKN